MMKKLIQILAIITLISFNKLNAQQFEYKIMTSIESVKAGKKSLASRSRLIAEAYGVNYKEVTIVRDKGQDNKGTKETRGYIRTKSYEETKLLKLYNVGDIRFENIAANDAILVSKINDLSNKGWELAFVSSSTESYGDEYPNGMVYTIYIFKINNFRELSLKLLS